MTGQQSSSECAASSPNSAPSELLLVRLTLPEWIKFTVLAVSLIGGSAWKIAEWKAETDKRNEQTQAALEDMSAQLRDVQTELRHLRDKID